MEGSQLVGLTQKKKKFSIRFTVGTLFIIATIATSLFAIALQYMFTKQMSEEHVLNKLVMATSDVSEYIQQVDQNAKSSARILSSVSNTLNHTFSEQEIRTLLVQVLKDNPLFYSIYFGNEQDDFYQIINLESSPIVRQRIEAAPQDRWVVIKISGQEQNRVRQTLYFSDTFKLTQERTEKSNYFPTRRPWYVGASVEQVFKTEPYLFKHLKITGQTYSIRAKQSVIGIDIVLSSISSKLTPAALGLPEESGVEAYVFHQSGEVIASNRVIQASKTSVDTSRIILSEQEQALIDATPALLTSNQLDWRPYDYAKAGEPQGYAIDLLQLMAAKLGITLEFVNGFDSLSLLNKLESDELDIVHSLTDLSAGAYQLKLFETPLALATRSEQLPSKPERVFGVLAGHDFSKQLRRVAPDANIIQFEESQDARQALVSGKITVLVDAQQALEQLQKTTSLPIHLHPFFNDTQIPFYLAVSAPHRQLIPLFSKALQSITPSEYAQLTNKWYQQVRDNRVPHHELFELSQSSSKQNRIQKRELDGEQAFLYVSALNGQAGEQSEYLAVVVPQALVMAEVYQRLYTTVGVTMLVMAALLPVSWIFGSPIVNPIRQLTQQTKKIKQRDFDHVELIDSQIKEVWHLSKSIQEMANEIKQREQQQQAFVDAFIQLIAQAIDDKSPYTAGHCNRVPELGMMLANAAEEASSGKFKTFRFENDNQRREFKIAAWLHDCGKITTPEHIVDKGTKLEANYNRIHEVRMRFEVLWRDAEITFLQSQLAQSMGKDEALEQLRNTKRQLQEDFEFVAAANVGGEFMSEEKVSRIKQIATQTWQRHFDDRLGLSPFEELNRTQSHTRLPVTENLLSDRPEHVIKRIRPLVFDPSFGINVDIPEHQYNLGEIYNLSISRGTLTAEDRFKINEHMISGIKMLEALPFPAELSKVPRYASTHHETLKGTGYPRKLSAEDLSIPERILVIADIFEALTAADRPYKKAKPVSVAIDILHKMAIDEHVDMDLFKLFLESGVYRDYAEQFLPEAQIDEVDIGKYFTEQKVA
ncbi:transporter substrate-binding domain-containing protein [Vibrio sp. 16]|uniref:HD domain-containing phosphohydrolase n=1 Tax=Vibrio sp. 16 TaxID=391586 RepID=UPI002FEE774D